MFKKLLLMMLLSISGNTFCRAMESKVETPLIETIPGDCAFRVIKKISKQPLITTSVTPYKILPTKELKVGIYCVLSRIAARYNKIASRISGWIPSPNLRYYYESYVRVDGDKEINYNDLKEAYEDVIFGLQHGWSLSLKTEKWSMISKESPWGKEEALFIRLLANYFGLNNLCCEYEENKGRTYLRIEENSIDQFKKIFGFDISKE